MKRLFILLLFAVSSTFAFTGCGTDYSDIPEVDAEETEMNEEEINKAMEAEMEAQMSGKKKKK